MAAGHFTGGAIFIVQNVGQAIVRLIADLEFSFRATIEQNSWFRNDSACFAFIFFREISKVFRIGFPTDAALLFASKEFQE